MPEELVDILDDHGQPTGEILSRDSAHARNAWHGIAHIWIYNQKGQILLQKRHQNLEWAGGKWDALTGGHISAGEKPLQAALREMHEEMGLNLSQDDLHLASQAIAERSGSKNGEVHKTHQWNYIAKNNSSISELKFNDGEVTDVKWMNFDDFESDLDTNPHKYAGRNRDLYNLILNQMRKALKQ